MTSGTKIKVSREHNRDVGCSSIATVEITYYWFNGPSELGIRGTLADWDRSEDLSRINVPTLVIGAAHDTMDPEHMSWLARQLPNGRSLICPTGSHVVQYDDPDSVSIRMCWSK